MREVCHTNARYTSDLTDTQWANLRDLLQLDHAGPGRPLSIDMREAVNGMLYVLKTGCQWQTLPKDFPKYQSIFYHYRKWCRDGTRARINQALVWSHRHRLGRCTYPSAAIMDSQSVKTTEVGGNRGYDAGKKVKGRKRHILVDTLGNLLQVVVHRADIQDRDGAKLLLTALHPMVKLRLLKLWAEGGYRGALVDWLKTTLAVLLEIVSPAAGQVGFAVLPRRWVVERTFAWLSNNRRLSKDYEETIDSSEGLVYLASIHLMLKRIQT